jgi:hypothetical protein
LGLKLSPTEKKEIFDADDTVAAGQEAVRSLQGALQLNDKAWGFMGAGVVSDVGTLLPESVRPKGVDATQELDNLVMGSAVPQLKAIFGGNPTEGERKVLMELAGSSSKNPSVRKGIYERAMAAAARRMQLNAQRAQELRGGTYFTPQGGQTPVEAPAQAPAVRKYNPATGKIE